MCIRDSRYLIRYNPYAALEGLRIAAHVVGARDLYVATRARYRAEIDRLLDAIREITADGVFDGVRVTAVEGPEEYLFGEEKALLNSIEEGQPLPPQAHQPPVERGRLARAAAPKPATGSEGQTPGAGHRPPGAGAPAGRHGRRRPAGDRGHAGGGCACARHHAQRLALITISQPPRPDQNSPSLFPL